ncbi:SDR family oxidoreductase [Paraburkholderia solisilvae]|uniref:NAD(P)H azoreductase n=1 Tax=Paraburkholderia solisilvae TaxID=624376 RepID=A0A6J5DEG4_9BURK|nr:NmrA family NAD(P)-binding protein [Paraburkholderia solisilvae]CAB3751651.1 NAD(P)H azoreductase [Paraburkholderia solisilvae]
MTYVIHGATGAQGRPVLTALNSDGKPVVALDRNSGNDAAATRVIAADYSSAEQLANAYRGAAGVFIHLPLGSEEVRLRYAHNMVAALADARPDRVVISTSGQIIDSPDSPLMQAAGTALPTLLRGVAELGLSHAIVAPRIYLENLLLPPVIDGIRSRGVLRYPLRADLPVSWASHLDVADVAVKLFERVDFNGVVAVGQYPPVTGDGLARAFSEGLGTNVEYEAITPEEFGSSMIPLVGADTAARIVALYTAIASLSTFSLAPEYSVQHLLEMTPRSTQQWLSDLGI